MYMFRGLESVIALLTCDQEILPVPVDVRGTKGVAVVEQRGVDQSVVL